MICKFNTVTSTQDVLEQIVRQNPQLPVFSTVSATFQTDGRGRIRHRWISEQAKNDLFSTYLKPGIEISHTDFLYQLSALAVVTVLHENGITQASVKYPNDILVNGKKIAGILVENKIRGKKILYSISGTGLNVNQTDFPPSVRATSILSETGKKTSPDEWIIRITDRLAELSRLHTQEIMRKYLYFWDRPGNKKGIIVKGYKREGIIRKIENGTLWLETSGKQTYGFPLAEIKAWI
jgi:BirA family biotin operon repressor/biotin-[acetyl-CoA-carboxylase] ligase